MATCERLSEAYLMPVIKAMLEGFPFTISGFRAGHGSEYINHRVARLLEKLRIELTMSRRAIRMTTAWRRPRTAPWCTSASATAIPAALCDANQCPFCAASLNPSRNFHRPCLFAEDTIDGKSKVKKRNSWS